MKIQLKFLAAIMVVSMPCFAQNLALRVGQQLPDLEINKILYHISGTAKLSDFKGKLVILDFWSTACGPCIEGMPKMDSLQKEFSDKVVILPVYAFGKTFTVDIIERIDSFWKTNKYTSSTNLPSVLDSAFGSFFPVRVGYQVWIDSNRIVRAVTGPEYVNKKEIHKVINGLYPQWESEIKENSLNKTVSEYLSRAEFSGLKDQNYSFFTNYLKRVDTNSDIVKSDSQVLVSYKNCPIISFYWKYIRANNLFPTNVVIETKDSVRYFKKGYTNEWLRDHSYCYELKLNHKVADKDVADYIRQDANKYFGLNGRLETKRVSCLILKKVKKSAGMPNPGRLSKTPISQFYEELKSKQNSLWQTGKNALPILNEIDQKSISEISYPQALDLTNILELRKVLRSQGYDIVEEKRTLKTFVISEIN